MSDTNSNESVVIQNESVAAVTPEASQEQSFSIQDFSKADEQAKLDMFKNWRRTSQQPEAEVETEVREEEQHTEEVEQEEAKEEIDLTTVDDFDKIDPNKLSPENFKLYKHMEKLMQKKSQNLSAEMREIQNIKQQLEQVAQQSKPQPKPVEKVETVLNQAKAIAMQLVGVTDPNEFQPDATGLIGNQNHYAALQIAMQHVSNETVQRAMVEQRAQSIVHQAQTNPQMEAEFDAGMYDFIKRGEVDKFWQVAGAKQRFLAGQPTMEDIDIIEKHWANIQTAKTKPEPQIIKEKPKPPKVESGGQELKTDKPVVDLRKFRNTADEDEKRAMIRAARRNGQI